MKTSRPKSSVLLACLVASALAGALFLERPAQACGAAFFDQKSVEGAIPTGNEAIAVTDHRMIVSIDRKQTVLYDQIRFTGHPAELAWILPVKGEVKLGLSTDALFELLDRELPLRVNAPHAQCPSCSATVSNGAYGSRSGGGGGGVGGCGSADSLGADELAGGAAPANGARGTSPESPEVESPVVVKNAGIVGPYETVQIGSADPAALTKWLADNGYAIPRSFEPTLAAYVAEKFEFVALKLRPGADTNAIRPIRVVFDGASNVVPMRASVAGPLARLGITMYVVAEGSPYAPSNYPVFSIPSEQLAWDWAAKKSTFLTVREERSRESGYSAWEIEGAEQRDAMGSKVLTLSGYEGASAKADQDADAAALGTSGQRVVTRLHATIAPSALTKDVVLEPAVSAPVFVRRVSRSIGAPMCATFDATCEKTGEAPTPEALETASQSLAPRTPSAVAVAGMAAALVALFRPRKRR